MLTEDSPYIDLVFSLIGQTLPLDNGYIVYSALSRICPAIHQLDNISLHPIAGIPESSKELRLTQRSKLQIRLPVDLIPLIYESLAGQTFSIGQHQFELDIPEYNPLAPFPNLYSRLVIIRRFQQPQSFLEAAKRQLERLNIQGTITLSTRANGQPQCVRWASAKLEEQGEEVKPWKVIWIAGLGEDYSQKVKAALEDELYRQSTAMASFNETLVDTY